MFKIGDKVRKHGIDSDYTIVFIDETKTHYPYLAVRKVAATYTSDWLAEKGLTPVPKFNVGEVWETRDGEKRVTIASVCNDHTVRYPIIGIFDANTAMATACGFTFDGHYEHNVKEDPQDLVKKIS
jgi:hypothetical protein